MNASEIEARRWFLQAQADLVVVFSQGSRVVWGHSVRELARQCEVHDPALGGLAGDAALLDQFYIPTRYPNGLPAGCAQRNVHRGPGGRRSTGCRVRDRDGRDVFGHPQHSIELTMSIRCSTRSELPPPRPGNTDWPFDNGPWIKAQDRLWTEGSEQLRDTR